MIGSPFITDLEGDIFISNLARLVIISVDSLTAAQKYNRRCIPVVLTRKKTLRCCILSTPTRDESR